MSEDLKSREETLLRKECYFPDCPGCKLDMKKRTEKGISYVSIFRIWIIVLVNALPISSLFPFLYFMVRDFNIAEREEDVGYYAGFVGASFMFGRALTSIFWGVMADRYGRKPIIIIGTVSVIIFNTLFGLSVNYWMAITTRFLLGSLNGLLGPIKAYASEILNEEHQALGMSAISTAWATGLVIGPALGGFLAQPAEKYPGIFPRDSLFGRFPYFLPCFCICFFSVVVLIFSFYLPETLHKHHGKNKSEIDSLDAVETATLCLIDDQSGDQTNDPEKKPETSLLRNWPLMSSIIVYCMFSLHEMAFSEVFSLWAVSPRRLGGLSYTTELVGEVLAISGFALLVFQMFLYPIVERAVGTIRVCRFAGILTLPLVSSFPYIALLTGTTLFAVLNVATITKNFLAASCITSLFILQNKAVSQEQRGAANGLSMTLMSICKTIGPAAGGAVLSWAENRQDASFLPGTHMVFFILNVAVAIGVLMTFKPFLTIRSHT